MPYAPLILRAGGHTASSVFALPADAGPNILAGVRSVVDRVLEFCDQLNPGRVAGLYLYGSATLGGLHPDSDIDLLLVTRSSLAVPERRG